MTTSITLTGLRGDNPLAFLAGLGTHRVLTLAALDRDEDPPRMSWKMEGGAWRPELHGGARCTKDGVIETLRNHFSSFDDFFPEHLRTESLKQSPKNKKGAPKWSGKMRFPVAVFQAYLRDACQAPQSCAQEYAAVWASEVASKEYDRHDCVEPTPLNFTAGNQEFITMVRDLIDKAGEKELREALFGPWRYAHAEPSLRWDPVDDRRYARSASDPSKQEIATVWGANRLALEGLPLLVISPRSGAPLPAGFRRLNGRLVFRWPIWKPGLAIDVVRSLLVLEQLDDVGCRDHIGIRQVYESAVVQPVGYYRNFSPARAVV